MKDNKDLIQEACPLMTYKLEGLNLHLESLRSDLDFP